MIHHYITISYLAFYCRYDIQALELSDSGYRYYFYMLHSRTIASLPHPGFRLHILHAVTWDSGQAGGSRRTVNPGWLRGQGRFRRCLETVARRAEWRPEVGVAMEIDLRFLCQYLRFLCQIVHVPVFAMEGEWVMC